MLTSGLRESGMAHRVKVDFRDARDYAPRTALPALCALRHAPCAMRRAPCALPFAGFLQVVF